MQLTIYNKQQDLSISTPSVEKMVLFLFDQLQILTDELIVHFVTKRKISQIHKQFFNDPSSTDCISFPLDPPNSPAQLTPSILGEIFICPKIAIEYGKKHQIDPYEETSRYLVHGILHLLGYDDMCEIDYTRMHTQENHYVQLLTQNNALIQ